MNGADRKAFKLELRTALRRQALGIPQTTQADVLLLWMDWLNRHDREGAFRLKAWAMGVKLWQLGAREGRGEDVIRQKIYASIDAMLREFSGCNLPG